MWYVFCFFQAEDGIRDLVRSRGLGDVYKRQDQVGEPGLLDTPETLEQRMLYQVKNEWGPDMDQAVYRIIYELHFVHTAKIGKISARRASLDTFVIE